MFTPTKAEDLKNDCGKIDNKKDEKNIEQNKTKINQVSKGRVSDLEVVLEN